MPVLGKPSVRMRIVRRRGRDLLGALVAQRDAGTPVADLCARAAASVDEYGDILIDTVAQASLPASVEDAERLRRESARILGEFAAAVRDIIPDREARHALAQAIQCAILRHERSLREINLRVACQP